MSLETVTKRLYEAMFLVDSSLAATDWDGVLKTIEQVLTRRDGEIVSMKKWDERRLAYEIRGKSRGTYILVYFRVAPDQVAAIERDVQLSETILRVLILRTDRMSAADLDKATPLEQAEAEEAARVAAATEARAARERERADAAAKSSASEPVRTEDAGGGPESAGSDDAGSGETGSDETASGDGGAAE